jgi:hypothetical protein
MIRVSKFRHLGTRKIGTNDEEWKNDKRQPDISTY